MLARLGKSREVWSKDGSRRSSGSGSSGTRDGMRTGERRRRWHERGRDDEGGWRKTEEDEQGETIRVKRELSEYGGSGLGETGKGEGREEEGAGRIRERKAETGGLSPCWAGAEAGKGQAAGTSRANGREKKDGKGDPGAWLPRRNTEGQFQPRTEWTGRQKKLSEERTHVTCCVPSQGIISEKAVPLPDGPRRPAGMAMVRVSSLANWKRGC